MNAYCKKKNHTIKIYLKGRNLEKKKSLLMEECTTLDMLEALNVGCFSNHLINFVPPGH